MGLRGNLAGAYRRCDAAGFCQLNAPIGDDLLAISGSSACDGWAVGKDGLALHWDGARWNVTQAPTRAALRSVWAHSPEDAWAVGDGGLALHWDGNTWAQVATGVSDDLTGVSGSASDDVWAVAAAVALHWDGQRFALSPGWTAAVSDPFYKNVPQARVVAFSGDNAFAVTSDGAQRWNGTSWFPDGFGRGWTVHLSASGPGDIWTTGASGGMNPSGDRYHFDGTRWSGDGYSQADNCDGFCPVRFDGGVGAIFTFGANDVWTNGRFHFDGTNWTTLPNHPEQNELAAVGADLFGITSESISRIDPAASTRLATTTAGLIAVGGMRPDDLWGLATNNELYRFDGRRWSRLAPAAPVETAGYAGSAAGSGANDVWFEFGDLWHWNGAAWSRWDVGGMASSAASLGSNQVAVVVDQMPEQVPHVKTYDGAWWHDLGAFSGSALWALSGRADDLWVAASSAGSDYRGVVWHWDGSAWTKLYESTAAGRSIYSVSSPERGVAWAVEVIQTALPFDARVLRWDGTAFREAGQFPTLQVVARSDSDVTTLGDGTGTFETEVRHFDGASWTVVGVFPGHESVNYFVAAGGTEYFLSTRGAMFVRP